MVLYLLAYPLGLLVGIPVGIVGLANLPVPGWRSQVAKNAPILLFPTYSSWDNAYKEAITNLNQADQLISRPTSAADLDLGGKKLAIAKDAFSKLPTDFIDSNFDRSLYLLVQLALHKIGILLSPEPSRYFRK
jgi:hypothetical protein